MYYRIVQYIYFTAAFVLCSIVGVALLKGLQAQGLDFFYLFTILCIPIFDKIIEYTKSENFFVYDISNITIVHLLKIVMLLILVIILGSIGMSLASIATLTVFFSLLLFKLDSRIAFLISLIFFLYIGFFLLLGNKEIAESISIYAYYFLIIGVIVEILQSFTMKKLKNEK